MSPSPKPPMKRLLAVVLLLVVLPAAGNAQGAEQDVLAVVHKLFDGMRQGDSAMVRPLFHDKARLITTLVRNGEPTVQVGESVEPFIQAIGRPRNEVWDERLSNERVFVDGTLASVWTDYVFYRGTTLSHCGVDHFLLVKEGAQWKILEVADTRRMQNCQPTGLGSTPGRGPTAQGGGAPGSRLPT